MHGFIITLKL